MWINTLYSPLSTPMTPGCSHHFKTSNNKDGNYGSWEIIIIHQPETCSHLSSPGDCVREMCQMQRVLRTFGRGIPCYRDMCRPGRPCFHLLGNGWRRRGQLQLRVIFGIWKSESIHVWGSLISPSKRRNWAWDWFSNRWTSDLGPHLGKYVQTEEPATCKWPVIVVLTIHLVGHHGLAQFCPTYFWNYLPCKACGRYWKPPLHA